MPRKIVKVTSQAELDAAMADPKTMDVWICGDGRFVVRLTPANKSVSTRETARVVLEGSSHVEARESSHVVARGSSSICAFADSVVVATKYVAVQKRDHTVTVTGDGVVIEVPPITTAEQWCEFYGINVKDGIATLFKAVRGNYASGHDATFFWTPGTMPRVPKMDTNECGVGLHAVAHPTMGLQFYSAPDVRFVACPVKLEDIRVTHPASYPFKVKFKQVAVPVYEVDRYGKALPVAEVASA
jgi:hypothetical protein